MNCPNCNSENLKLSQTRTTSTGEARYQYQCNDCKTYHTSPWELGTDPEDITETFVRDDVWIKKKLKAKTYVFTSAQSNVETDEGFLDSLHVYCQMNKAELFIIPIKHSIGGIKEHHYEDHIKEYLITLGSINIFKYLAL